MYLILATPEATLTVSLRYFYCYESVVPAPQGTPMVRLEYFHVEDSIRGPKFLLITAMHLF